LFNTVYNENVLEKWWIKKHLKRGVDKSGTYVKSCSEMPGYGKHLL
jgi:hypothetical protein